MSSFIENAMHVIKVKIHRQVWDLSMKILLSQILPMPKNSVDSTLTKL